MTIKKLLLLLLIVPLVFLIQSCGKGAGDGYTPPGSGPGSPVYIKLKPSRNAAQTNGCIEFYAEVHDAQGELLANIPVTFTNLSEPLGVILERCGGIEIHTPVTTDGWGRAKITIMSTTPGFVTVLAQTNLGAQPRDRKTVLFSNCDTYDCLVLAPSVQLDADSEPPDGIWNEPQDFIIFDPLNLPDDKANLLATVRNEYGVPIPYNAHVVWGADHIEAAFTRSEAWTNENGQASAQVEFTPSSLRDTETHVNVWAYSDNVSQFIYPMGIVTFFLQPVFISSIDVTANPSVVAPEGNSAINAVVWLNTGDYAFDGVPVTFRTCDAATCTNPCGIVDPFAQTLDGEATAEFTAPPIPDTCRVIAAANGVTGFVDILVTTALTVTPDSIDVNGTVGGTATFTIYGGVAPYTVVSDSANPTFDPVPATVANSGDTFVVTVPAGTPDTTVTYTVRDSMGDDVTASVVITPDALSILPDNVDVDGTVGGTATFTVFGGTAPYIVVSDNADPTFDPVPATVANSGDTFVITVPAGTEAQQITYTVRDSSGDEVTATIDISTDALAVFPESITIDAGVGGIATFTIFDGVPGYDVFSSDPALPPVPAAVANSGDTFAVTVPAGTAATSVTYDIRDASGETITATLDITLTPLAVNPISQTISCSLPAPGFQYVVTGGVPVYASTSLNPAILGTTDNLTGFLALPTAGACAAIPAGTSTTVTITVQDSAAGLVNATCIVTNP